MGKWEPISTAPIRAFNKEDWYSSHSDYLLLWDNYPIIGSYGYTKSGKGRWQSVEGRGVVPTHWMRLPGPPEDTLTNAR